jgi:hypothetical protein
MTGKLYFLEPSKVGVQHIYLLEGYLRALTASHRIGERFEIVLCTSKSTARNLSAGVLAKVTPRPVFVMNPEKRRLALKTLVEFWAVFRRMLALRPQDILLVTCVLPTSLILIEWANRLLRRRGVHVVLHGDIEGIFASSRQGMLSIGFWAKNWLRLRRPRSRISLVVLDDFIKRRLIGAAPEKLSDTNISVVQLPVMPVSFDHPLAVPPTVGFLGYRTQIKSFEAFARLPALLTAFRFVAIGGGKIEDLRAGTSEPLAGKDGYLAQIARCSVACFPYTAGYTASLSASALDALSTGVQILALDRPCFAELSAYFGDDVVRVVSRMEEIPEALSRLLQSQTSDDRTRRLQRVADSKYGVPAVQRSFERMLVPG